MNKKESKYFSTAAKMDAALIDLLEKKDFEYITVKEICEKAGVNRSTFYLHYENTVDLLTETTRYVIDGFLEYFKEQGKGFSLDAETRDKNDLIFMRREYIMPYLSYVKDNRRVFMTSLRHMGQMGFEKYYEKMFNFIFNPILDRFNVPQKSKQYVIKFYLTGVTAIAVEWLEHGCAAPIEDICNIIINCTTHGILNNEN